MSSAEIRLITKIVETGDLSGALRAGITVEMFGDPLSKEMFETILLYHHEREHYGCVPTARWMGERFKDSYRTFKVKETLAELCAELRGNVMQTRISELLIEICDINETDPKQALGKLRSEIMSLSRMIPKSTERILAEDVEEIISRAALRRDSSTILGIPYPWDDLNQITQGMHSEDFIVIFGRPKSMKSWIAAKIAAHAYLHGNRRIMIYSCEMSTALFEDRLSCAIHELSYTELKQGTISTRDWQWYKAALRALPTDEKKDSIQGRHRSIKFISHLDDPHGGGVSHLMSKIDEFDPDLVVVDSFYKMKDDRTGKRSVNWEAQYGIVQDLKGATQILHIPLIGVTQRKRTNKEETEEDRDMADIAYADAVGQEAEAVFRVKKEHTLDDKVTTQLRVMMTGSRETAVGGFLLHVIPAVQFKLFGWLNDAGKLDVSPLGVKPPKIPKSSRMNSMEDKNNSSTSDMSIGRRVRVPSQGEIEETMPRRV
jgi:replicative DNA helicase